MNIGAVDQVIARILKVYATWVKGTPVAKMRADWDALFAGANALPPGQPASANGVAGEWIGKGDGVILFLHGGGFRLGSLVSHRDLATRIGAAAKCRVLSLDYRLVPEHRFPAPVEDAVAAYRWLLDQGIAPSRITFVGDSAGGGLCVSAMLSARMQGLPLPAAAVLMSPWTDMEASGESYSSKASRDPIHQKQMLEVMARVYLGDAAKARDPLASPIHGDLRGLPPMLVQVGEREVILDDSRILVERAKAQGVDATLEIWDGMIHVFQLYADELPEGAEAIGHIGSFIKRQLGT